MNWVTRSLGGLMRTAVIQHRLQDSPRDDAEALTAAVRAAVGRGAELIVVPHFPSGRDAATLMSLARDAAGPVPLVGAEATAWPDDVAPVAGAEALGPVLAVSGDACFDPSLWSRALDWAPNVLIMSPLSENDLQAEAALEVAIALSDALAGLVIVAECAGGELGEPGHGGSAVILVGSVLAEAFSDGDILVADVTVPVPQPEPRDAFPQLPTILAQRLAHHEGRRLDVGYLADV